LDTPLGTGEHRRTQTHAALRIVAQRCGGGYGSPRVSAQRARARINTTHTRARVLHQDISYQQIIRSDLRSDLDHEIRPTSRNRTLVQKSDVHREIGPPSEIGVPSKSDPKSVPTPKSSRPEPPTQGLVGFGHYWSLFGTPFWALLGPRGGLGLRDGTPGTPRCGTPLRMGPLLEGSILGASRARIRGGLVDILWKSGPKRGLDVQRNVKTAILPTSVSTPQTPNRSLLDLFWALFG